MAVNYKKEIEVRDFRNGSWFWVQTHVWRDKRLGKSDKIVYATIASYVDNSQHSYPSIETIGRDGDISPRQVHYSIKKLEKVGYLSIKRRRGKSNFYDLMKTETPSATTAPLQPLQTTPAKTTVPTPAKTTLRTISIRTISKNKREITPTFIKSLQENQDYEMLDVSEEIEKLKDWLLANGKRPSNKQAFARNWMRKARQFYLEKNPEELPIKANPDDDFLISRTRLE